MVAKRTICMHMGKEKYPCFNFLIPYGRYMKEKTRRTRRTSDMPQTGRMKSKMTGLFARMANTLSISNTKRRKTHRVWRKASKYMSMKIAGIIHSRQATSRPRGTARYIGIQSES